MKIIGKFFAFIFSCIYCLLLTSIITLSYSTNLLKGDFYTQILDKVDLSEINVKVSSGNSGETINVPLKDILVDGLVKNGMDEETAIKIIENDNIKRVMGNVIGEIINYQLTKENIPEVSKEDIISIINDPDINKEGATFTDEQINEIHESINVFLSKLALEGGLENANS